ncbi:MAG: cytochrome c [Planctomycetota bacterium]|nr:cytochrome c [Planctomycetota bacterium]
MSRIHSPPPSTRWALLLIVGACVGILFDTSTASAQTDSDEGAAAYATMCARCHGLTGDGRGPEVLDRPARDFTASGFSFGNTEEAIARTIRHGIPGSPMPAFGETLSPELIDALALHVRSLTPETEEPDEAETILTVREHPLAVRGGLPPIAANAAAHVRGMMLGLPGGISFEYRVPDLVLLGVRAGDFARRADWTGRGGASLEPLGKLLWLNEQGTPRPAASIWPEENGERSKSAPLMAQLRATRTPLSGASFSWDAVQDDGTLVAHIDEQLRAIHTPFGSGFARILGVTGPRSEPLVLHHGSSAGTPVDRLTMNSWDGLVVEQEEGAFEITLARSAPGAWSPPDTPEGFSITLPPTAEHMTDNQETTVVFITLLVDGWNPDDQEALQTSLDVALGR